MMGNSSSQEAIQISFNSLQLPSSNRIPQLSRHLFAPTLTRSRRDYTELDIFRQQIEQNQEGLHHQPYTASQSMVRTYKLIFYGFGLLFGILAIFVMLTTTSTSYPFFNFSIILKSFITMTCGFLSLTAFLLAIGMRTEREAIRQYVAMARANLAKIYARKRMKMGSKRFIAFFGKNQKQVIALKQAYHEISDKINERKVEALHLVKRIANTRSLDNKTKETLYNQAISELNDKLILLTHTFKHSAIPHFNAP